MILENSKQAKICVGEKQFTRLVNTARSLVAEIDKTEVIPWYLVNDLKQAIEDVVDSGLWEIKESNDFAK